MASICDDPKGRKRILIVAADGKRKPIRLGKASMKQAETVRGHVEHLLAAKMTGDAPPVHTLEWLRGVGDVLYDRLEAAGLIQPRRGAATMTLAEFVDGYIAGRTDVKPGTIINFKQARKNLVDFFGADKPIAEITEGDADEFWRYLLGRGLAVNTARGRAKNVKTIFRFAVRKKHIAANPFQDLESHVGGNDEREFFVTRAMAEAVLAACSDDEWRLIFALARYGGLRCPSELLALRWIDVDWEAMRMTVHAPKTEAYEGKATRVIPIFPELYPWLLAVHELPGPPSEYVITRYRDTRQNLRTQLERIIRRAGLEPWAKPFQNLRSTRETELAETFPLHVVTEWIGNSAMIAKKHYLQVTDEHYRQATRAAQKTAQCSAATHRKDSQPSPVGHLDVAHFPAVANLCDMVQEYRTTPEGFEPSLSA